MNRLTCLIEAIKESSKIYNEYKKKKRLLDKSIDYEYLEKLVKKVNEDPDLLFRIYLTDGTKMEIATRQSTKLKELDNIYRRV